MSARSRQRGEEVEDEGVNVGAKLRDNERHAVDHQARSERRSTQRRSDRASSSLINCSKNDWNRTENVVLCFSRLLGRVDGFSQV